MTAGNIHYLGSVTDTSFLKDKLVHLCAQLDIPHVAMPEGLRVTRRGSLSFVFNYLDKPQAYTAKASDKLLIGAADVPPRSYSVWLNIDK